MRVQEVVRLIFHKFDEFGSANQILRWLRREGIEFPGQDLGGPPGQRAARLWRPATYRQVVAILKNPFYSGVYAYGKSEGKVEIKDGVCRKTYKHSRPPEKWTVRLAGHHIGYIDDAQFTHNQEILARNTYGRPSAAAKSARGGRALLTGLLRCQRCGHKLSVVYSGKGGKSVRYSCSIARRNCGETQCVWFGATRPDLAVGEQILAVVQPHAVDAAILASQAVVDKQTQLLHARRLEVQQSEYEARLAARRYEAVDPDNRLVAGELEARWNAALTHAAELRETLKRHEAALIASPDETGKLHTLARDLGSLWQSDRADMRLKQRIVRTLIVEIVVDRAPGSHDAVLTIHWRGGRHSTLTVQLPKTGEHRRQHTAEAISLVQATARAWSDEHIAAMLNRGGHQTGQGLTFQYGNATKTAYAYDPLTFRLDSQRTTGPNGAALQFLVFTHDAVGNVTAWRDLAQPTIWFDNATAPPVSTYTYDSLYRLVAATGRESATASETAPPFALDSGPQPVKSPLTDQQVRPCRQSYEYDKVGNLLRITHTPGTPTTPGWGRVYAYEVTSRRLVATTVNNINSGYTHDSAGNMVALPYLNSGQPGGLAWDWANRLATTTLSAQQVTGYGYAADGQRRQKATGAVQSGGVFQPQRRVVYLPGGLEIVEELAAGGSIVTAWQTVSVDDGQNCLVRSETQTAEVTANVGYPVLRYQIQDQVGSVALELTGDGDVLGVEEFYLYGDTAYWTQMQAEGFSRKRYRYNGKEKDEESGLYYYGARYYAAWLGRWTACATPRRDKQYPTTLEIRQPCTV